MIVKCLDRILSDSFGGTTSILFSSIDNWNQDLPFDQRKEAFFWVVEKLINEGVVKFLAPNIDCYKSPDNENPKFKTSDEEAHWKLSPKEIVSNLKDKWPENVVDAEDMDLTIYFLEIPSIIWLDGKGGFFSS